MVGQTSQQILRHHATYSFVRQSRKKNKSLEGYSFLEQRIKAYADIKLGHDQLLLQNFRKNAENN
jgi:hypothetical protein